MVILNKLNKILVCERNPKDFYVDIINSEEILKQYNYWQLPQGGLDADENALHGAEREAKEEVGLKNLKFIFQSKKTNTYFWNNSRRGLWKNKKLTNPGQTQNIVYFKFLGKDSEVKIDNKEFINFKWIEAKNLLTTTHPERKSLIKIVLEDLKEMREKGIIDK